jgi:hypothetical protein
MRARIQHHRSLRYAARMLLLAVAVLCAASLPQAQTTTAKPAAATSQTSKHHKAHTAYKSLTSTTQPVAAVQPPAPNWPVNDQPARAAVIWDSRSLRIDAANSSLLQILADVTAATGAKIEGTAADQRVFGIYGPGNARDVLTQLLQGSGYNIVMMGENDQGVPREVVLTERRGAGSAPAMAMRPQAQPDDDFDDTPEPVVDTPPPPPPQPVRPGGDAPDNQQKPQQMQPGQPPATQPNN